MSDIATPGAPLPPNLTHPYTTTSPLFNISSHPHIISLFHLLPSQLTVTVSLEPYRRLA